MWVGEVEPKTIEYELTMARLSLGDDQAVCRSQSRHQDVLQRKIL